jgi:soluble lytic murein transglycosylase-like protein
MRLARRPARLASSPARGERGQAVLLVLAILAAVVLGGLILAGLASGVSGRGERQRAADLAALAAARKMRAEQHRVFEPPLIAGRPNPVYLSPAAYRALAREAAVATAARNGAQHLAVTFPGEGMAPVRVRVEVRDPVAVGFGAMLHGTVSAEAELVVPGMSAGDGVGAYTGPLAVRQGKRMRPDVALAFDRMAAAARADGVNLTITSAYRTDAEQAALFAAHPDPNWVAPAGKSLHRLGTELDLGPQSAYGWLARNAGRFGFVQRYRNEPWHYGYTLNAGTRSVGVVPAAAATSGGSAVPAWVPDRYVPALRRAASRWSVSAALLAAQIRVESNFNPRAVSDAGAQGIAQFMPGTARSYGLRDPFDPDAAIDAQAHMMRDLLRAFGAVPLALAAYNAGPGAVRPCMCVPDNGQTRAYVANILGLLDGGAGQQSLPVRLVA